MGKNIFARIPAGQNFLGKPTVSYLPTPGALLLDGPLKLVSSQHLKLVAQDATLLVSDGDLLRLIASPVTILNP